jgi:hypothetical protein
MTKKKPQNKKDRLWAEAKRKCRLNDNDIRIARELGLNPRSLIKNIPSRTEPWKLPVKAWIHEIYKKRQEKTARKKACKGHVAAEYSVTNPEQLPEKNTTDLDVEDSVSQNQDDFPDSEEIQDENQAMERGQEQFRVAAEYVADSLSNIPEVHKVVLFGSVAKPLEKEVPRFRKFRRAGIAILHECQDADMAVWISDLRCLKAIQKARSQGLNSLFAERGIGVAHHQIDIFVIEPETNRYLGRLCVFGSCPKGKDKCLVPGCGEYKFPQQHEGFRFEPKDLDDETNVVLFERYEEGS